MIEQYLIHLIKDSRIENICLESDEKKCKWFFSCYIGKAFSKNSQEVWIEGNSPFQVLEEALKFIDRYERGLKVGIRKKTKWEYYKVKEEELICENSQKELSFA